MKKLLTHLRSRVFYEEVDGKKFYTGGLLREPKDSRDFQVGSLKEFLGLSGYKPQHERHIVQTYSTKDQSPFNTCGWNSATLAKEADEAVVLSVRGLVMLGKREGYISRDGFSNLRENMKVIQKFGIPEERFLREDVNDWEEYSRYQLSAEMERNAYSHRSQSFYTVSTRDEVMKILDSGKVIHTGSDWYNEFNMRGGFAAPWIIKSTGHWLIGGHAFSLVGYDVNYKGQGEHYIFKNSYGPNWGDNGLFYMPVSFAHNFLYTKFVQLDIPVDTTKFLRDFNGKNVRAANEKAVYFIRDGYKEAYPDWLTFLAYGGIKSQIEVVDQEVLKQVPLGGVLDIKGAPFWPIVKEMAKPDNYKKLLEITGQGVTLDVETVGMIYSEMYS